MEYKSKLAKFLEFDLVLHRFNDFEELKKYIEEELKKYNLKVKGYNFKGYYDNDFEDYNLMVCLGTENEDLFDLDIWYAIARNGARVILETSYCEV